MAGVPKKKRHRLSPPLVPVFPNCLRAAACNCYIPVKVTFLMFIGDGLSRAHKFVPCRCLLLLAALLLHAAAAWGQAPGEKIVFSIPSRSIASIDLYIAKEKGFFREEGLDVDLVQIRGNVAIAAALSGQVQASNGVSTVIRAMERSDLPLKVLTVSLKRNLFWLVARPNIKSIAGLKN